MNSPKNTSIYLTSKDSNHRLEKISASEISIDSKTELQSIRLHTNNVRQSILGFGGAFTEASASIYDSIRTFNRTKLREWDSRGQFKNLAMNLNLVLICNLIKRNLN